MNGDRLVPAPAGLAGGARKLWRDTQRQLRRQSTWEDTDAPLLESYVRAVALARSARAAASERPFIGGSKGQLVAHPGLRVAAEAERDACRFAQALLLTPQARARHDVKPPAEAFEPLIELLG